MAKQSARSAHKPLALKPASKPQIATNEVREPRGTRRRRETRTRLLDAALRLMAVKGMEGVAINEITEAADVGFGSFYNHFESKEAIYLALIDHVFGEFADALDRLVGGIDDPAEVIAVSIRHTVLRARREPVWGQFLVREGFSERSLTRGLGQRLGRDIQKGIAAKRFSLPDPEITLFAVGGTVIAAIAADLELGVRKSGSRPDIPASKNLADRVATVALQILGLTRAEAEKIARRPLRAIVPQTASD